MAKNKSSGKTILFDWFGVVCNKALIDWAESRFLSDEVLRRVFLLADQVDVGEIDLAEFHRGTAALIGQSVERLQRDLMDRVVVNREVIAIVRRLNEGYRVSVLSNVNIEFITAILTKHDLTALFHPVIASSTLKLVKPDPKIFRKAIEILGCVPKVFIDDTAGHVDVARTLGITGIVFESANQLERDLLGLGLL